jgi:DNA-binding Lrp family transcriptional regulator
VTVDDLDRTILARVQREFPLSEHPFEDLGRALGVAAGEVFRRVSALRRAGVIRRVGPLFDSRRLGFRGTLVAVRCEPDAVDRLASLLDRRDEVTHNYLREGTFNVWFTVLARDEAAVERILREVREVPGVRRVLALPNVRVFKLDTRFGLS